MAINAPFMDSVGNSGRFLEVERGRLSQGLQGLEGHHYARQSGPGGPGDSFGRGVQFAAGLGLDVVPVGMDRLLVTGGLPVSPTAHYKYKGEMVEPDWKRIPGYSGISAEDWRSNVWQRRHSIKTLAELKEVLGDFLTDAMAADIQRDQNERATMGMLVPPHMLNTMTIEDLMNDSIRRYMIPMFSDRDPDWPSHPMAQRDSLHETDMREGVDGLTWRYREKVLVELTAKCPQYCGHCTRDDSVGPNTAVVKKNSLSLIEPKQRYQMILDFLEQHPEIHDVVVSGGDIANVPINMLVNFVESLLRIKHIRTIRLASKGLVGLPQYFLQDEVLSKLDGLAKKARGQGVHLVLHTHANHPNQVTPLVAEAAGRLLDMGFRDVRNQGVLLRGVNDNPVTLLDLLHRLVGGANITPYYFYMCDNIPHAEHWRIALHVAQGLQLCMLGERAGFQLPRIVCDVPDVGKRWVHQADLYDRTTGISWWKKNAPTAADRKSGNEDALRTLYPNYDPMHSLPPEGRDYWSERVKRGEVAQDA